MNNGVNGSLRLLSIFEPFSLRLLAALISLMRRGGNGKTDASDWLFPSFPHFPSQAGVTPARSLTLSISTVPMTELQQFPSLPSGELVVNSGRCWNKLSRPGVEVLPNLIMTVGRTDRLKKERMNEGR